MKNNITIYQIIHIYFVSIAIFFFEDTYYGL